MCVFDFDLPSLPPRHCPSGVLHGHVVDSTGLNPLIHFAVDSFHASMLPLIFAHYPPQLGLYETSQYTQMNKQGNAIFHSKPTISAEQTIYYTAMDPFISEGFS